MSSSSDSLPSYSPMSPACRTAGSPPSLLNHSADTWAMILPRTLCSVVAPARSSWHLLPQMSSAQLLSEPVFPPYPQGSFQAAPQYATSLGIPLQKGTHALLSTLLPFHLTLGIITFPDTMTISLTASACSPNIHGSACGVSALPSHIQAAPALHQAWPS